MPEGVLIVRMVVQLPDTVVTRVRRRESAQEARRRSGVGEEAAGAGGCRRGRLRASEEVFAGGASLRPPSLQSLNRVHHAVRRIASQSQGRRKVDAPDKSNERPQAFVPREEEELVFLDRPADHTAKLLELSRG